ncbi:MAG: VWA domain-containing protein [Chlamydiae bacterium]|nr:VWA domain-containing protein [Chlamydiota bacterium]
MFSEFHFAHPLWLFGVGLIPLVWALFFLSNRATQPIHRLENFIDSHLLPYLLVNKSNQSRLFTKGLVIWTLVWSCMTLGLAGPRWSFREVEVFSKQQHLVILLDLSLSMNAADVKPSRLARAKQKIEDILSSPNTVKIGLIAYAADPHMITPITDDKETIRHLLPSLDTSLVYVQGSRLSPALDMAGAMLDVEPGTCKSIVILSDGGFEDAGAISKAKEIGKKGIVIHTMGVGTEGGAPIVDHEGRNKKKNGVAVISKLDKTRFQEISSAGNGRWLQAEYSYHDENAIFQDLEKRVNEEIATSKKNRFWQEHFYLCIIPILPIFLLWFRRGKILVFLPFLFSFSLNATEIHFKNPEQLGQESFAKGDYEKAAEEFEDPYRKGVAYYNAGKFSEAETMFKASSRQSVALSAVYNLGNSLAKQQKLKEAISAYEDVLEQCPEDSKTRQNLDVVKKMLAEQKDEQKSQGSDGDKNKEGQEDSQDPNPKDSDDKSQDAEGKDTQDSSEENKEKPFQDSDKPEGDEGEEENPPASQAEEKTDGSDPEEDKEEEKSPAEIQNIQSEEEAEQWLNRMESDPKAFMKNKFYIESKKNAVKEGVDPW